MNLLFYVRKGCESQRTFSPKVLRENVLSCGVNLIKFMVTSYGFQMLKLGIRTFIGLPQETLGKSVNKKTGAKIVFTQCQKELHNMLFNLIICIKEIVIRSNLSKRISSCICPLRTKKQVFIGLIPDSENKNKAEFLSHRS